MFARLQRTLVASYRRLLGHPFGRDESGAAEEPPDPGGDTEVTVAVERAAERLKYSPETTDADTATVIDALDAPDREAQVLAVRTIADLPPSSLRTATEAVGSLIGFLDDDTLGVRIAAARALAHLAEADPGAVATEAPRIAGYLADFRIRVSDSVAATLGEAAKVSPETVAPLVFEYVDPEMGSTTRRNAARVLYSAAEADPGAVKPVVPALVALLDQWRSVSPPVVDTLAVVADDDPEALASAVPALVSCAEERPGKIESAAIRALAELGSTAPSSVRPAVPVLTEHLADEESKHREAVARTLVRITDDHPEERETVACVLADMHGTERLRAARTLAATGTEAGADVAEAAVGDSPLGRYLS